MKPVLRKVTGSQEMTENTPERGREAVAKTEKLGLRAGSTRETRKGGPESCPAARLLTRAPRLRNDGGEVPPETPERAAVWGVSAADVTVTEENSSSSAAQQRADRPRRGRC